VDQQPENRTDVWRFNSGNLPIIVFRVSTVPEIIDAVNRLNEEQKGQFLAKLADINFDDAWDRQMEADAKAGRLDFLWDEAKREIAEGKTRPLDELLGHE
jgi:hypothetical protein